MVQRGSEHRQGADLGKDNMFTEIPMGHLGRDTCRKRLSLILDLETISLEVINKCKISKKTV